MNLEPIYERLAQQEARFDALTAELHAMREQLGHLSGAVELFKRQFPIIPLGTLGPQLAGR